MDKLRMSNIFSSVQMSPRDRKDFIKELSKLGQGGADGGEDGGEDKNDLEIPIIATGQFESDYYYKIKDCVLKGIPCRLNADYYNPSDVNPNALVYTLGNIYTVENPEVPNQFIEIIFFNYLTRTEGHYGSDNANAETILGVCILQDNVCMINVNLDDGNFFGRKYLKFPLLSCFELIGYSASQNLDVIGDLKLGKHYNCVLSKGDDVKVFGSYYNGTFIAFEGGKIQVYDVNLNTGAITLSKSINPELIGTVAKLEVGDADDICQRNLELINMAITQAGANHFDVDIDYGVGSATFTQGLADDAIAGTATIIVATGYVTKYNLYGNGKVEKVGNDIDLFALEARIAALEGA